MTITQQARIRGFNANLAMRGRPVTTDTQESLTVLVRDRAAITDPDQPAQAKIAIYTAIEALAGAVADPRAIGLFTEADGRWHKVLQFIELRGDLVKWVWDCEAQRL
jgi:hypothetical protein